MAEPLRVRPRSQVMSQLDQFDPGYSDLGYGPQDLLGQSPSQNIPLFGPQGPDMRPSPSRPLYSGQPGKGTPEQEEMAWNALKMLGPAALTMGGGPAAMTLGRMALPIIMGALSPYDHPDPNVLMGGASKDPEKAIAKEILNRAASGEKSMSYSDWESANPGAENELGWDFANAKPAPFANRPNPPRYSPPRGVKPRMAEAIADPDLAQKMIQYANRGVEISPEPWYNQGPLYEEFLRVYGRRPAPREFENWAKTISASSARSSYPDNIRQQSYYRYLINQGVPIPDKPAKGYGSIAQQSHVGNARELAAKGFLDPFEHPKPVSMTENLMGNLDPITADTHNQRIIGMLRQDPEFLETRYQKEKSSPVVRPRELFNTGEMSMEEALKHPEYWSSAPKENEYGASEGWQQGLARSIGQEPGTFQGNVWIGGGVPSPEFGGTGLASRPESALRTEAKRILYTAQQLGEDPRRILNLYIKGKIPLLGAAGVAAGTAVNEAKKSQQKGRPQQFYGPAQVPGMR